MGPLPLFFLSLVFLFPAPCSLSPRRNPIVPSPGRPRPFIAPPRPRYIPIGHIIHPGEVPANRIVPPNPDRTLPPADPINPYWQWILQFVYQDRPKILRKDLPPPPLENDQNCIAQPLTAATWKELKLDDYLRDYPGGQQLSLTDYAASKGISNFVCGIGQKCNVGQLCYPLHGFDWYVLFAAQQWNAFQNVAYTAIHESTTTILAAVSSIINTFRPPLNIAVAIHAKEDFAINAAFSQTLGTFMQLTILMIGFTYGAFAFAMDVLNIVMASALSFYSFSIKINEPSIQAYALWTQVTNVLNEMETKVAASLSDATKKFVASGISTKEGLYGALSGGQFLFPAHVKSIPERTPDIERLGLSLCLNVLLRAMNAYVTAASEPCNQPGPNGARSGTNLFSWCDSQKVMWNIVIADHDNTINEINGASAIQVNYNISTETITQISWRCQQKYGYGYEMYTKNTVPKTAEDPCIFNLYVCWTRNPDVDYMIQHKHVDVTKACRIGSTKVPI